MTINRFKIITLIFTIMVISVGCGEQQSRPRVETVSISGDTKKSVPSKSDTEMIVSDPLSFQIPKNKEVKFICEIAGGKYLVVFKPGNLFSDDICYRPPIQK